MSATLPNIFGRFTVGWYTKYISVVNHYGAFYPETITAFELHANTLGGVDSTNPMNTYFNANRCSSSYQNNAEVRPNSVMTAYYIKYV